MTITIPEEASTATLLDRVAELAPLITEHAPVAERAGQLTDEVVAALHAAGVFRMMVPPELGGDGLTLSEAFPVMQAVARCDGATGWNVCIGATSLAVAAVRLPDDGSRRAILGDATTRTLIAGGISPTNARAVRTTRGFRFSGRVPFASGSAHATWMMMLAPVFDGDSPVLTQDGTPDLVAGLFAPSHAEHLDTWHVSGLRATASSDYLVDDVFVPHERTFRLDGGRADCDPLAHRRSSAGSARAWPTCPSASRRTRSTCSSTWPLPSIRSVARNLSASEPTCRSTVPVPAPSSGAPERMSPPPGWQPPARAPVARGRWRPTISRDCGSRT
jgi:hypothetical protein